VSTTFFTDRDLGTSFPAILREAGILVERHTDHFAHNEKDEVWLTEVGRRGWVGLTHNLRIRYQPNERDAVIRARLRLLVIIGKAAHRDLAASFVNTIGRIEAFLEHHEPPLIAKVYRPVPSEVLRNPRSPGKVEAWYP
jgi:hypothetical protein